MPASPSAGHPEAPPGDPEPFNLAKTTTGQRLHLDRHGHTRTAPVASAIWSRSWPVSACCWLCQPTASIGHPQALPSDPEPFNLAKTTTGQRLHLDRHGRHPHRVGRVGDLVEIQAGISPI